jgi:Rrf2 family transcriptional regulator, nitric oxide-sensitive transcriptional repressor
MISQTAEYALRAMVFLSMHETANTVDQIAETTKVPGSYLSKILQQLVRAKLVRSQRGIGGGFTLVRSPDKMSILDVVNAVDPIHKIESCPLGISSHGINLCPLHQRLSDATATVETAFRETLLSDLVRQSKEPLCKSIPFTAKKTGARSNP